MCRPAVIDQELLADLDRPDRLHPQPLFLCLAGLGLPVEEFAVGVATVVHIAKRRGWIEQPAAGKLHDIARILRVVVEDRAPNFAEYGAGRDAAAGEGALPDMGLGDPEQAGQGDGVGLEGPGMVGGLRVGVKGGAGGGGECEL